MRQLALGPRRSFFAFAKPSTALASTFGSTYAQHMPKLTATNPAHAIFGVPLNLLGVMAEVGDLAVQEHEMDTTSFRARAEQLAREVREWKGVAVTSEMLADSSKMLQETATHEMTRQYVCNH